MKSVIFDLFFVMLIREFLNKKDQLVALVYLKGKITNVCFYFDFFCLFFTKKQVLLLI